MENVETNRKKKSKLIMKEKRHEKFSNTTKPSCSWGIKRRGHAHIARGAVSKSRWGLRGVGQVRNGEGC